jgi:hypothetical protein
VGSTVEHVIHRGTASSATTIKPNNDFFFMCLSSF